MKQAVTMPTMRAPCRALTRWVENADVRPLRSNHGLALHTTAVAKPTTKTGAADIAGTAIPHYLMEPTSNQYATKCGSQKHLS